MTDHAGTVSSFTRGQIAFHTYTAPEGGFRVNTHIVETPDELTVIDANLAPFAREAVDVIKELGKPVARFIITHAHADHFSGLQVLDEAFPGTDIYALQTVRDYLAEWAQPTLDARRAAGFGELIAERAVYPTHTLETGPTAFPGLRIDVAEVAETEAHTSSLITFPDAGVLSAADNIAAPGYHLFNTIDGEHTIENWIALLQSIAGRTDVDIVLTGHGPSTDPKTAAAAGIDWLHTAAQARAQAADAAGYAETIKTRYPGYRDPSWADYGSMLLFGLLTP